MGGIVIKQEDKELLLTDLCARLPYGVKCIVTKSRTEEGQKEDVGKIGWVSLEGVDCIGDREPFFSEFGNFKLYLFPFSSITEKQKEELNKKFNVQFLGNTIYSIHYHSEGCWDTDLELSLQDWLWFINWCYKNHFDIYGLIPMGLALDATGLNIY